MQQLPIFVDLDGADCLIVGGGVVAERKARLLLRAGANLTMVAPTFSDSVLHLEDARVQRVHSAFRPAQLDGQRLVIAASNDPAINKAVSTAAARSGLWCNVVDNPALSTFIVPAIVDRSPVIVAIGTGGTAPVLAQRLKTQIEAWLPARIGELATQAGRWRRRVRQRFATLAERRRYWQSLFSGPVANDLLAGRREDAVRGFRRSLTIAGDTAGAVRGAAWLVGAGPGDPELITLRGQRLLSQADVVLYDALVAPAILDYARKDAERIAVGKQCGGVDSQAAINRQLVDLVRAGHRVCRLKGGDPTIFGRGGEEAAALAAAGIPCEVVPGISAAPGCAAAAGFPLTHRGLSSSVTFATAIVGGSEEPDWTLLARSGQTLAVYMAVSSLRRITSRLMLHGLDPATPAAIVENGTRAAQRIVEATVADIAGRASETGILSPATPFIGRVVSLRHQAADAPSPIEPLHYMTGVPVQAAVRSL
ncbi:MAG: siroheme synthase CysG [Woeseiaceae bacterium]|nr:siroheme synthase CysG [Woeseiaceae bacterium]